MFSGLRVTRPQLGSLRGQASGQSVRTGSLYLAVALGISGVMTFVFQSLSYRFLGLSAYGALATLWSATFLFAQVLWIGTTQALGRYVAEREARGEDWQPVVKSVRHLEILLLGGFLVSALALSPVLTRRLFGGEVWLTVAFVTAIAGYALSYFRRGLLAGHRQFARLSGMFVIESLGRVSVAVGLLVAGIGVLGPAAAIAIAPLLSVLFIRVAPVAGPKSPGAPFSVGGAFRFAMPVLVCMACAQALANGGPILISGIGGQDAHDQAGLLLAALTLTRAPQFMLSPVVTNLLPHLSRIAALEDLGQFKRFVRRAVSFVGVVCVALVSGTWLFGELAMRILYGEKSAVGRELLTVLAALAAAYLMCELLNQVLFARGFARLAAASWMAGLAVTAIAIFALDADLLTRVSYGLALGTISTAIGQAICYLATLDRRVVAPASASGDL